MSEVVEITARIDAALLDELRATARELDQSIGEFVQEALVEHLRRVRVRPVFRQVMDEVLKENKVLLDKLAK